MISSVSVFAADAVKFDWLEYSGRDVVFDTKAAAAGHYRNPILTGFYPDPSICQVGQDYYLINSTFAYFPGIPVFHSRDLVNWKQLGHVIDRPDQLRYDGIDVSGAIFAPAISYNKANSKFYVVCTMIGDKGNFVMTADNPAGPWSDPVWLHFEGIDPSLFFDDDGRAWMVNNGAPEGKPLYDGHRAIWIQEFDIKAQKMIGPRKVMINGGIDISTKPIWIEGPHILKKDGWYYICSAEGGTGPGHSQVILRSKTVDGPYTPWEKNPILTQRDLDGNKPQAVTCTGHADMVIGPDGNWWAVFLGVRPYKGEFSPMGRETFLLPVKWTEDGWPAILPAGERVPYVQKSPGGATQTISESAPLNGNFTWRDDFSEAKLSPLWIMLRTPKETWWKVDPTAGKLELEPRKDVLAGRGNPSFFGRRVQHSHFSAALALEIPREEGVTAGLAVYQNEKHHYFLAVHRDGAGGAAVNGTGKAATLFLERYKGGKREEIGSVSLPEGAAGVELRVQADEGKCSFSYATQKGDWNTLVADADATMLTTRVAGGFVGVTVGPHVRLGDAPAVADIK